MKLCDYTVIPVSIYSACWVDGQLVRQNYYQLRRSDSHTTCHLSANYKFSYTHTHERAFLKRSSSAVLFGINYSNSTTSLLFFLELYIIIMLDIACIDRDTTIRIKLKHFN